MSAELRCELKTSREGPDGRVLLVRLSNPAMRNAMSPNVYADAPALFADVAKDRGIGAVVLAGDRTADGSEHFCGGGNLKRLLAQRELPPATQAAHLDNLHAWVRAMRACPQPVIAAVEGAAAGGGFSVALGCDLMVAAEDARFVMSYVRTGLTPDGGGSDALAKALPPQTALAWLLDGTPVAARRLFELGLASRIVPPGQAVSEALAWAGALAAGPFEAQASIKRLVHAARSRSQAEQLDAERDSFVRALYGDEAGEGMRAFLEKRKPDYSPPAT